MLGIVGRNKDAGTASQSLRRLVDAIVNDDAALFSRLLDESSALATSSFTEGATRQDSSPSFIKEIGHYIYTGDTALHFAAAAYRSKMAESLIEAGAQVRARNRRGCEPLHAAAFGSPGSPRWDPTAQAAIIGYLIGTGADPNAQNMDGATPLHRAVRTRCAEAARVLLANGADPMIRNKNGSTALQLASKTTGRSGSGSPEAKAQQEEILILLQGR
jgi:hypothetical protein